MRQKLQKKLLDDRQRFSGDAPADLGSHVLDFAP
jgi:hypothetical protein